MAMRAYNRCTVRLIPLSWRCRSDVASEETMSFEEGDCFQSRVDGGIFRIQKPTSIEVLSAFLRWGFGASCGLKVREETGRLFPV